MGFQRAVGTSFFARDTLEVARSLVGAELAHGDCAGVIVEVEAYTDDAASHFVTRPRTGAPLMGETHGRVYLYRIYGQHVCLNFTTDARGPGAVLLRAVEPTVGLELMRARRGRSITERDLARGPARLVEAFGVSLDLNGRRVTEAFRVRPAREPVDVVSSSRIGISSAQDLPWRFCLRGSRHLSRPA